MSKHDPAEPADRTVGDLPKDDVVSSDDPSLSEYDKTLADSFPTSDPPAGP